MKRIKQYIKNGWPDHKKKVPTDLKQFWSIRNYIFLHENILFYNKRLIIPDTVKQEFMEFLHKSHQRVVSTKLLAQETVYWPGLITDLENFIRSYLTCQKHAKINTRELLKIHRTPDLPLLKIGIDFKSLDTLNFIVIVDYFIKCIIVNYSRKFYILPQECDCRDWYTE